MEPLKDFFEGEVLIISLRSPQQILHEEVV